MGFRNRITSPPFLEPTAERRWVFCFPPHAPQAVLMPKNNDQTVKTKVSSHNQDREMRVEVRPVASYPHPDAVPFRKGEGNLRWHRVSRSPNRAPRRVSSSSPLPAR